MIPSTLRGKGQGEWTGRRNFENKILRRHQIGHRIDAYN